VSRAARMGVELPGDVAIRVRELGGERGGLHSNGISKAVMDVAGPKARGEQAKGRQERAAVCAEELIGVRGTLLEGAYRLDARNEVHKDGDIG